VEIVAIRPEHVNGLRLALDSIVREGGFLAMDETPKLIELVFFVDGLKRAGLPQFVALDGKRVVGWCDIRDGGVLGMGVIASHRRSGLGSKLLQAASSASPFPRTKLTVFASNTPAIAFYLKHGFAETGRHGELVMMER
jgi:ribosomal protein S18 acetylase RimI-like enzyme